MPPKRQVNVFVGGVPTTNHPPLSAQTMQEVRSNNRAYSPWLKPFNQAVRKLGIAPARRDLDDHTPVSVMFPGPPPAPILGQVREQGRIQNHVRRLPRTSEPRPVMNGVQPPALPAAQPVVPEGGCLKGTLPQLRRQLRQSVRRMSRQQIKICLSTIDDH